MHQLGLRRSALSLRFVLLPLLVLGWHSSASANLIGFSLNATGGLKYEGLGPVSPGVGSGRYTIGACSTAGGNTACTTAGSYTEEAGSTNVPGMTGLFTMVMSWAGTGVSPITAASISPGSDLLQFIANAGALFTLTLTPSNGAPVITATRPSANPFSFFATLLPSTVSCTGTALPIGAGCTPGQVGLVNGAVLTGQIERFTIDIPSAILPPPVVPVPEPASLALTLLGLAGLGFARRRGARRS